MQNTRTQLVAKKDIRKCNFLIFETLLNFIVKFHITRALID